MKCKTSILNPQNRYGILRRYWLKCLDTVIAIRVHITNNDLGKRVRSNLWFSLCIVHDTVGK